MNQKEQLHSFVQDIHKRSDRIIEMLIWGSFVFGLILSLFYETWVIGIGVGVLNVGMYFLTKYTFKDKQIHHFVASAVMAFFMAQFIYQMHGLFEMHFVAFISATAMITYQNWKVFIPLGLIVVVHHASFAYVQYAGVVNENEAMQQIYFTQLEYMDLQTFIFHAALFAVALVLSGVYSWQLSRETERNAQNIVALKGIDIRNQQNIQFANSISQKEFDYEYTVDEGDSMGRALMDMRNNLETMFDRESKEKFHNTGTANIGELIHKNGENLDELAYEVIHYVVTYLGANQGGFFVLNDLDEKHHFLELKGCYAYERKKYLEKNVAPGEGLVGQCFLEAEFIHITQVPENYVNITSGLGDAKPKSLLLIPLKDQRGVQGVIELASFKKFEDYHIELLQKIGENLASAISNVKINQNTKELYEQTRMQAEDLRSTEEEMRQNQEELMATQEEMKRQKEELEKEVISLKQEIERLQKVGAKDVSISEPDPENKKETVKVK